MTDVVTQLMNDPLQLVIDDACIASQRGLVRRLGKVRKAEVNPVLEPSTPFDERGVFMFGTVLHDEGRYRAWYMGRDREGCFHPCYAESDDGVYWIKPNLGPKIHNVFATIPSPNRLHNLSVIRRPNDPDRSRCYAAALFMRPDENVMGPLRGYRLIYSADGIHWTLPEMNPAMRCNESGALLYDESRCDFIDLNKLEQNEDDPTIPRRDKPRQIAVATSPDGTQWSRYQVKLANDPRWDSPADEMYGMTGFRYGGHYVGFLRVFHNTTTHTGPNDQCIDLQLATSRDGVNWQRVCPGEVFLPVGEESAWDFARVAPASGPPIRVGDQMRCYYTGQPARHTGGHYIARVGFATMRLDGFVSLDADHEGELLTEALNVGSRLRLNVDAAHGDCRVELLTSDNRLVPGFTIDQCIPITGDRVDAIVHWRDKRDIPTEMGPLRLHVALHSARLYAWTFQDQT